MDPQIASLCIAISKLDLLRSEFMSVICPWYSVLIILAEEGEGGQYCKYLQWSQPQLPAAPGCFVLSDNVEIYLMFSILQLGHNGERWGQPGTPGQWYQNCVRHLPLEGGGFQLHAAIHKTIGLQTPAIMTYLARSFISPHIEINNYFDGSHIKADRTGPSESFKPLTQF